MSFQSPIKKFPPEHRKPTWKEMTFQQKAQWLKDSEQVSSFTAGVALLKAHHVAYRAYYATHPKKKPFQARK